MPGQQFAQVLERPLLDTRNLGLGDAQPRRHLLLGEVLEVAGADDGPLAGLQPGQRQGEVEALLAGPPGRRSHRR